jgi:HlyD family secretion protein
LAAFIQPESAPCTSMRKGMKITLAIVAAAVAGGGVYAHFYGIPSEITLPVVGTVQLPEIPFFSDGQKTTDVQVYVTSLSTITGRGVLGLANRYTGKVETRQQVSVSFDSGKTLGELFVSTGDTVSRGDPLFSYNTEEIQQKIQQADLELEEMNNTLSGQTEQLDTLQKAAAKAGQSEQEAYRIQILQQQNTISRQQYDIAAKQLERARMAKDLDNIVVTSPIDGVVKTINSSAAGQSSSDGSSIDSGSDGSYSGYGSAAGSSDAYITILETGDFRVHATVNEMNFSDIYTGEPVLVTARADESRVYSGTISKIETEADSGSSPDGMSSSDSGSSSSKYSFYVDFNEGTDLMLGQHVVITPDTGEERKDGLWIPTGYLFEQDGKTCVWAADSGMKIRPVEVETGETDEETGETEILSGLTLADSIAWPEEFIEDGMSCADSSEMTGGEMMEDGNGAADDSWDMFEEGSAAADDGSAVGGTGL